MATRSSIAVKHGNNVKAIYCHWDGYLENVGTILLKHYNSAKANNLVALGDVSSLGTNIGEAHDFDRLDTMCEYTEEGFRTDTNFYIRDRGEEGCEFCTFASEAEWLEEYGQDYNYLMDNGVWYVSAYGKELVPLHEAIENAKLAEGHDE